MSDYSQGDGWWQASDGKWYPPEQAPQVPPTAPVPPVPPTQPFGAPAPFGPPPGSHQKKGLGSGPIIGIVVAIVAVVAAIVFFATRDDGDKKPAAATSSSRPSSPESSTKASGAPDVDAPNGFKVFSNDDERFALALPESMDVIDLSAADVDQLIDSLGTSNPALADLGPQIRSALAAGGKLFAVDKSTIAQGFADNLNVIAAPGAVDLAAPGARSEISKQLGSIGGVNIEFGEKTAHGRKVVTVSYEATINGADGTALSVFGRQAYVSAAGHLWVLTLSTSSSRGAVFDTIVESFDVNE